MKPAVDHQAEGAVQFQLQHTEITRRVGIHTHFLSEPLRIQTPAFGVSRYTAKFTEGEVAFQFGLDRELQTVAQNTFVVKQRQSKDRTDLLRGAIRFENR